MKQKADIAASEKRSGEQVGILKRERELIAELVVGRGGLQDELLQVKMQLTGVEKNTEELKAKIAIKTRQIERLLFLFQSQESLRDTDERWNKLVISLLKIYGSLENVREVETAELEELVMSQSQIKQIALLSLHSLINSNNKWMKQSAIQTLTAVKHRDYANVLLLEKLVGPVNRAVASIQRNCWLRMQEALKQSWSVKSSRMIEIIRKSRVFQGWREAVKPSSEGRLSQMRDWVRLIERFFVSKQLRWALLNISCRASLAKIRDEKTKSFVMFIAQRLQLKAAHSLYILRRYSLGVAGGAKFIIDLFSRQ